MASDYLAWALADFSGYLAADELYDGPFCVLSVVDNRRFKRLAYEVLDHDPTQHCETMQQVHWCVAYSRANALLLSRFQAPIPQQQSSLVAG